MYIKFCPEGRFLVKCSCLKGLFDLYKTLDPSLLTIVTTSSVICFSSSWMEPLPWGMPGTVSPPPAPAPTAPSACVSHHPFPLQRPVSVVKPPDTRHTASGWSVISSVTGKDPDGPRLKFDFHKNNTKRKFTSSAFFNLWMLNKPCGCEIFGG